MYQWVIKWSDGYPTTFYKTIDEAREALEYMEDKGITGELIPYDEY